MRWLGIGALVLVVLFAFGAWNKHRNSERMAAEQGAEKQRIAKQQEAERLAEARRQAQREKAAVSTAAADNPDPSRDRPSRERDSRPAPTVEEFMRKAEQDFRSADANSDGYLDRREMERFPVMAKAFQRVDADGDGRVSRAEFLRARSVMAQKSLNK